jgi:Outer membrane lipoprotein carrier protein LolA-like
MIRPALLLILGLLAAVPVPTAPVIAAPIEATPLSPGQILRGRFEQQRFLQGFQAPLKSSGTFVLSPGLGLIWKTEKPFALTTVMSPAGLVQEVAGRETMRLPSTRIPFMSKLYAMLGGALTGDWEALSDAFNITRKAEGKAWRLKLEPKRADDPAMPIRAMNLHGSRFLEDVDMVKPNGDHDRIVFLNQKLEAASPTPDEAQLLAKAGQF